MVTKLVTFIYGRPAHGVLSIEYTFVVVMMTSSNGNIFHVTGPLCGDSPVTSEFPSQRPVTRSFDVFFDLCLNKRLSKQSWGWWFETPSCSLWRHCYVRKLWEPCDNTEQVMVLLPDKQNRRHAIWCSSGQFDIRSVVWQKLIHRMCYFICHFSHQYITIQGHRFSLPAMPYHGTHKHVMHAG